MIDQTEQVKSTSRITPENARDSITVCFIRAHKEVLDSMREYNDFKSEKEFEEMERINVLMLIKSIFKEVGGDFDNPTKDDLQKVLFKLSEYAANFRKPEMIKKHYDEMTKILNELN